MTDHHISLNSEPLKSTSKSYLFMKKLKKIQSVDRQIRLKWAKINTLNKNKSKQQIKQNNYNNLHMHFQYDAEKEMIIGHRIKKIQSMKEEKRQFETHLRNKQYEQIYYGKHKSKNILQRQIILSPMSSKRIFINKSKTQNSIQKPFTNVDYNFKAIDKTSNHGTTYKSIDVPIMFQKRNKKIDNHLKIISFQYQSQLTQISSKEKFISSKQVENQKNLLEKMKGSKLYYKMASSYQLKDMLKD